MSQTARIYNLLRRRYRARRLDIEFRRGASWVLPSEMFVNGRRWAISAPNDNGTKMAFLDIFLDDCYGIESIGHPVRTVLDIGAHAGFFSMHARNTYPDAIIHAYEPNPNMKEFLEHQSGVGGFTYFLEAVGNKDDMVLLDIEAKESVHTRCRFKQGGEIAQVAFHTCILRLGGSVDILKMDCEGAEWSILADTESLTAVRSLVMEYDLVDGHTEAELVSTVKKLGFRVLKQTLTGPTWGLLRATR
jgi:FkbM family methyltransferase